MFLVVQTGEFNFIWLECLTLDYLFFRSPIYCSIVKSTEKDILITLTGFIVISFLKSVLFFLFYNFLMNNDLILNALFGCSVIQQYTISFYQFVLLRQFFYRTQDSVKQQDFQL